MNNNFLGPKGACDFWVGKLLWAVMRTRQHSCSLSTHGTQDTALPRVGRAGARSVACWAVSFFFFKHLYLTITFTFTNKRGVVGYVFALPVVSVVRYVFALPSTVIGGYVFALPLV